MIYVVIPTYKEIDNIGLLLTELHNYRTIVVDDNSPDGTAEAAEERGAIVIRRPGKLGIGSAVTDGLQKALSYSDCQYVVTMDADSSHDPKDIPRLLAKTADGVGLVQGSRYMKGGRIIGWGLHRKLLSYSANKLCQVLFSLPSEVTTSFRMYSRAGAQAAVDHGNSSGYEFAITTALAVRDKGLRTVEVPITFTNRTKGKSKLKPRDTLMWLTRVLKLFWKRNTLGG